MGNTGVFGGTFDPPHLGHIRAAEEAVRQLGLERLIIVPACIPPHKEPGSVSAGTADRLEMLRKAFAGIKEAEVSDIEIKRGGVSFTADTVSEILEKNGEAKLWLLVGKDMFLSLERWHNAPGLLRKVSVGAFSRDLSGCEGFGEQAEKLLRKYGTKTVIIRNDALQISSTEIRKLLRCRKGREFLDAGVYAHIIRRRLYGAKPDFGWLREQAYAMLAPSRIPHAAGTEETAARLAKRWDADVEDAREAAILHDITKRYEIGDQLLLCEEYGIITDNAEKSSKKLLHAKTGAEKARAEFGIQDAVYSAIMWHTTGKPDMALLDKIIYIADYIEPTRNFPGLEALREKAFQNLDEAVLMGLTMSLDDLRLEGITPHPRTMEAIRSLKAKGTGNEALREYTQEKEKNGSTR